METGSGRVQLNPQTEDSAALGFSAERFKGCRDFGVFIRRDIRPARAAQIENPTNVRRCCGPRQITGYQTTHIFRER